MFWLNLFLLALMAVGSIEVQVALINRARSFRLSPERLRFVRHIHDVLIPLLPAVLFWFVGLRGPALLRGGRWSDMTIGWALFCCVCGSGMALMAVSSFRWMRRRVPDLQLSNHSWTIDVVKRVGTPPLSNGPFRWMARLPRNEIFQIDVSEKRYSLPSIGPEWDGLSVLHLSDFHWHGTPDRRFWDQIIETSNGMEPDLIVFTGDLLDDPEYLKWVPETLGTLQAPLGRFFVLGNHDWPFDTAEIRGVLSEAGWQDTAGLALQQEYKGRTLAIGGTERPWMGDFPDFSNVPKNAFRMLLSHTPDQMAWARQQQVDLMLAGHNHGGQIVFPVLGPIYSPSREGVRYIAGAYWEAPTLLYVSRGLSSEHPVRYNSPPELTKLVLHAPAQD
jgi:hypothetical protein